MDLATRAKSIVDSLRGVEAGLKPPPALHEEMRENGMDTASVLENDKLTEELYEEIKARTMFKMIDKVDGGKQSLLFLTNKQAELLRARRTSPSSSMRFRSTGSCTASQSCSSCCSGTHASD